MDLSLTSEQEQMKETLREFLASEGGIELARRQVNGDDTVVEELWQGLSEMGYTGLTVPESNGGFGEDIEYLSLVLEEAGRIAMPGPLPETLAFCVPLIGEVDTEFQTASLMEAVADGETKLSFALYEADMESLPDGIEMSAIRTDAGYRLEGVKTLVPYGDTVDMLVVGARTSDDSDEGISLFLVDTADVSVTRLDSLDATRPLCEVQFDGVEVDEKRRLGPLHGGGKYLQDAMDRFSVAICSMMVGAAEQALDQSVEYSCDREQYGHPIGRFQAVKHRLSDMWMKKQMCQSLAYYAAWAVANDTEDKRRAVSAVKSFATTNCIEIFSDDILTHGALGYTWDHDAHLYLKQARAWEHIFGSPRAHRERIADERGI